MSSSQWNLWSDSIQHHCIVPQRAEHQLQESWSVLALSKMFFLSPKLPRLSLFLLHLAFWTLITNRYLRSQPSSLQLNYLANRIPSRHLSTSVILLDTPVSHRCRVSMYQRTPVDFKGQEKWNFILNKKTSHYGCLNKLFPLSLVV